ncbi:hypothetical protein OHA72_38140 [Dactylosporangium sp. NBC_01737]|uniref:GHMP family kinase ATP-binding protein n=1 Tax=Dactylosporangium sp. NBC_01737 TaxID=2975959 RepID=UPI002E15C00A|nr:hypothetical protein OHA72_38140 [Dactylosporangium sp. NBC_01737]
MTAVSPAVAVMCRAPMRVSLAGGGTDLPSYASRFGGRVLTMAIDRFVTVSLLARSFDGSVTAAFEETQVTAGVEHLHNAIARVALHRHGVHSGLQIASFTDAPSGTGLGSSAAFGVALLGALAEAEGRVPDPVRLAEDAGEVERTDLRRPVGKQDHYAAALGGVLLLDIDRSGRVTPAPVAVPPRTTDYLSHRLLVFHVGQRRDAGAVLDAQATSTASGDRGTIERLHALRALVEPMLSAVTAGAVDEIGPLLDRQWRIKRELSPHVSTSTVDRLYDLARRHGADGGRLLGAGGGGCLLVSVEEGRQPDLRAAMAAAGAHEIPFIPFAGGAAATALPLTSRDHDCA